MGAVERIYEHLADIEGRSAAGKSQIWGQTIASLGQIPAQMQQQALLRAREQRLTQQAASEQQLTDLKLRSAQRQEQEQSALDKVWGQDIWNDQGEVDVTKASAVATQNGFGHLIPHIRDQASKWSEQAAKTREAQVKADEANAVLDNRRRDALGVAAIGLDPSDDGTFSALIGHAAKQNWITPDEANRYLSAPPEARKSILTNFIRQSKEATDRTKPVERDITKEQIDPITGVVLRPAQESLKPTEGELDAAYQKAVAKRLQGQPLTPDESTMIKAFEKRKTLNPITVFGLQNQPLPQLPPWTTDASRPVGPEGNQADPTLGLSPNGLYQAAITYIQTGQFPPTSRGNSQRAWSVRSAVENKVGAMAADAGMDVPTFRAFYKANASSLGQQQKMMDAAQGFLATADKNSELLEKALAKIPDTGSPLFNQPYRAFSKSVLGNPNLSQFSTYLASVQNEYAKIISQPTLAGQLTDSARHEAQVLVDPNATVTQILASLQALRNEGSNRLVSVGEQIQRIQKRIQTPGGGAGDTTPQTTTTPSEGTLGTVNGVPAVWKTVNGKTGWYAR